MFTALKKSFPKSQLSVLVRKDASTLLEHHKDIQEVIPIDKRGKHRGPLGMYQIIKKISQKKFDLILAPHRSFRTSLLSLFSGAPKRIGYNNNLLSPLSYNKLLKRDKKKAEIDRLLEFLGQSLNISYANFNRQPSLYVNQQAYDKAKDILIKTNSQKPILVAPSSIWPTKRWPVSHFSLLIGQLVRTYKRNILLIGSTQDNKICQEVMYFIKAFQEDFIKEKVFNIAEQTSLPSLYALMKDSFLLVSNDSAPVHIACAASLPVVAIFGPTTPSLGYAPLTPNSTVAQIDLDCRPCSLHGQKKCPKTHFRCMKDLSHELVLKSIEKVLKSG